MTQSSADSISYLSERPWNAERPRVLVVACSDGRLQQNVDDFLRNHLGISDYDRLYMPGGPGALAQSGFEFLRADQWRRESNFLIGAHQLEEVILIFHAASVDGPIEANCADYHRKLPTLDARRCREQQDEDADDVLLRVFSAHSHLKLRAFRAEVRDDGKVQFVDLLA
jgi:hypothetical protein